jgi:hypothetical protein
MLVESRIPLAFYFLSSFLILANLLHDVSLYSLFFRPFFITREMVGQVSRPLATNQRMAFDLDPWYDVLTMSLCVYACMCVYVTLPHFTALHRVATHCTALRCLIALQLLQKC